jgi:hypothetical protein
MYNDNIMEIIIDNCLTIDVATNRKNTIKDIYNFVSLINNFCIM